MENCKKEKKERGQEKQRGGGGDKEARLLFLIDLKSSVQFGKKKAPEPLDAETEQAKGTYIAV